MEGSDVILTPKRYAVAQYDIIPTPQTTPATTPYDTLDYATQLSAVRQAIYTILVGGQRATMGTVTYSYAELKELRALEKDLILRVAYSNGQYGMSVAQIDSPADRGGVNLGF
jgi:hypothetical protein